MKDGGDVVQGRLFFFFCKNMAFSRLTVGRRRGGWGGGGWGVK